jgi:hypothetical protein
LQIQFLGNYNKIWDKYFGNDAPLQLNVDSQVEGAIRQVLIPLKADYASLTLELQEQSKRSSTSVAPQENGAPRKSSFGTTVMKDRTDSITNTSRILH